MKKQLGILFYKIMCFFYEFHYVIIFGFKFLRGFLLRLARSRLVLRRFLRLVWRSLGRAYLRWLSS